MSPPTFASIASALRQATATLPARPGADVALAGMLLLKRASDLHEAGSGRLHVPHGYSWRETIQSGKPAPQLNKSLSALETANMPALDGLSRAVDFGTVLTPRVLHGIVDALDVLDLHEDSPHADDTVGRAFDQALGDWLDAEGKRAGGHYTPRSVIDLMVRLTRPASGQAVYDPCAGSGGMLTAALGYVRDHHPAPVPGPRLFGQDIDPGSCLLARINLLLHGVDDASVLCGDTLADPLHTTADRVRQFNRVLANPPFSMHYDRESLRHPERMAYGFTSERGRADLMYVQHVLAVLQPDGVGAVVTPHGVLFRTGAEQHIRRGVIEDGRVEAVINIGANVFYGTSIPACILVLRGVTGLPDERRGQVLFVNAEHEAATGRSRNELEPRHIEKIVQTYREWRDVPGFSRVVSVDEIAAQDYSLNIHRYVAPPMGTEALLDIRAALVGGVPKSEVEARGAEFRALGIEPTDLFTERDADYFDFLDEGYEHTAARISELASPAIQRFADGVRACWAGESAVLKAAGSFALADLRRNVINAMSAGLAPAGLFDRDALRASMADWWAAHEQTMRVLQQPDAEPTAKPLPVVQRAMREDLVARLTKQVAVKVQALVHLYLSWGDRYATSLADLEEARTRGAAHLDSRLRQLGLT